MGMEKGDHSRNGRENIWPNFERAFNKQKQEIKELRQQNAGIKSELEQMNNKFDRLLNIMERREQDEIKQRKGAHVYVYEVN